MTTEGYTSLGRASLSEMPEGETHVIATSDRPLGKEFTIFSPEDPHDARVEIRDLKTGAQCSTGSLLVSGIKVSSDERSAIIYSYSGSNAYEQTIDTTTCLVTRPATLSK